MGGAYSPSLKKKEGIVMADVRICKVCHEEKSISSFYKRKTGQIPWQCKSCSKKLAADWTKKDRENNPDKYKDYGKAYYRKNKEKINLVRRLLASKDREKYAERSREWQRLHPEQTKIIAKRKYIKNRDNTLIRCKIYRDSHKEEISIKDKSYRENNKEKVSTSYANRRARKRNAEGSHSAIGWKELKESYLQMCVYCNNKFEKLDRDHVVPLINGGSNYINNIVPACTSCNSKKNSKSLLMFMLSEVVV